MNVAGRRLANQRITDGPFRRAVDVVTWFGAVQAQEYEPAKWGVGLRMPEETCDEDIERAFQRGEILRTHVMRPTWHFVAARDIRWLLELTAPRVHRALASYNRQLELDQKTLAHAVRVVERALRDGRHQTRLELRAHLQRAGIIASGQRLAHIVMHAELEGVIVSGPRRGKQFTYALLAERAPDARSLPRDEALAGLARRYFRSHGPATVRDCAWWSGLTIAEVKRGLEMIRAQREEIDGVVYWSVNESAVQPRRRPAPAGAGRTRARDRSVHLLPIYDEYVVAYRDRVAVPHAPGSIARATGTPVMFQHPVIIGGQIAGTWRSSRADRCTLDVTMLRAITASERRALVAATKRYARFRRIELTPEITCAPQVRAS